MPTGKGALYGRSSKFIITFMHPILPGVGTWLRVGLSLGDSLGAACTWNGSGYTARVKTRRATW
jgi:hypothetical protein